MSATERRDKNAKIKKLGNRVLMNVAHTVHHHTRTRVEQDVSLKAWVIKNLLFRFSSLTLLPFFVLIFQTKYARGRGISKGSPIRLSRVMTGHSSSHLPKRLA